MKNETRKIIDELLEDPASFAMLMENDQIEQVIVDFVSVLIQRKLYRGSKN